MKISQKRLKEIILEELTKSDVKDIVSKEVEKQLSSRKIRKIIEDEIISALGKPKSRDEVADIAKKVLKRLYKDMSVQHPYMIDRIKV
jgi:mannitol-1-phosphate/altronate dehydrogenase